MESPPATYPTLDPNFEEYLTKRLQQYADASATLASRTSLLDDGDVDSGIHTGVTWGSDGGDDESLDSSAPYLSTASCPVSPAPARARVGYRPQRPLYDPTRGILRSITEGNTRRLSKLLGRRPNSAASQEDLAAPLIQAIRMGQDKCVLSLLSAGADPNGTDDEGKTPLYLVMETAGGNPEILRALLKAKAHPDQATWNLKHTPLQLAAKKGYQVGVKQLLAAGARPDKKDAAGNTPLMFAAKEGHVNIVRALLREGASANGRNLSNESIVHFAAKCGSVDCLSELLQAGANPNDRDSRGQTALLIACRLKHSKAVEILLDYECDVNGQDTNSGKTALHWAIQNGDLNIVTELLDAGADPNIKDKNWTTPFLLALGIAGGRNILELLLHAGCDVTVTDRSFNTALHLAATEGQVDLLPALVDAGIMVDIKGAGGVTSLMLAAYGGHLATVKQLLQYGANPNLMDRNRASALTYAILSKANDDVVLEIIKMLIRSNCALENCANLKKLIQQLGVDLGEGVEVEDLQLYSPIDVAYLLGKTAIFMIIIKAGASANSFTDGASGMLAPLTNQQQEGEQRNRWYLMHCLRKEQQEIKSLVELCRRPALDFLSRQYKGHSYTMPEKICQLPFSERVKSFLNYDDLDEVQAKYNVTLRDKQSTQKKGSQNSNIAARESSLEADKRRISGAQNGISNLRTSFRRSGVGLNRNSAARQSLPIGFSSHRSIGPLASSTPKAVLEKPMGGRYSVNSAVSDSSKFSSPNKPTRTSLNLSSASRLNTPRQPVPSVPHTSTPRPPPTALPTRVQRPSSTSTYPATEQAQPTSKMASSTGVDLSRNLENHTQFRDASVNNYSSLKKPAKTGRFAQYEKLENAYDELRSSMIAAGSISDMSSSSNSLVETRQIKRRGRYSKLDPTQMLLSPPLSTGTGTDNDSVFFNGEVSPRSMLSDDSSTHSGGCKDRVCASSPTESKSSTEEADSKEQSILKYHNMYNKNCASSPIVNTVTQQASNNSGKIEWGLKCLRSPKLSPGPKVEAPVIMDEQDKKLLEDLMKEVENNRKTSDTSMNPDERPLTPMDEQTKKAIYDKRWARALSPSGLSPSGLNPSGLSPSSGSPSGNGFAFHGPRSPTIYSDAIRSPCYPIQRQNTPQSPLTVYAGKPLNTTPSPAVFDDAPLSPSSPAISDSDNSKSEMKRRLDYNQQAADRSLNELRTSMQNLLLPVGPERKGPHFGSSARKLQGNMVNHEKNGNLIEPDSLDDYDPNLKRWGTMTLDDPEVLDNSENFTSDKSLRTPTGRTLIPPKGSIADNTTNNINNNRSFTTQDKLMASSRPTMTSHLPLPGASPPKVGHKSWAAPEQGYASLNRNQSTSRQVQNHAYLEDNCRNKNVLQVKIPSIRMEIDSHQALPAGGGFKRNSAQYSSMRVRGTYGHRSAIHDSPQPLERTSRTSFGPKSRDSSPVKPLPVKTDLRSGTKGTSAPAETGKKLSAGSRIKMAFLNSASFRH